MFKKIASKFAKSEPSKKLTPYELDAQASISTLDGCYQLLDKLQASRTASLGLGDWKRTSFIDRQMKEAELAKIHYQVNEERARVEAIFKRDSMTCDAAKSAAQESHLAAVAKLQEVNVKHQGIFDRLIPLQDELARSRVEAEEAVKVAQANFDAAIAAGDTSAETIAAEKLHLALKVVDVGGMSGPLTLRIAALQRELDAAGQVVADVKNLVAGAEKAIADTDADLALLSYDKQVNLLLDAWVAQKAAVSLALKHHPSGRTFRTATGSLEVDLLDIQIGSPERALFGASMDYKRKPPQWVCEALVKAAMGSPNLEILAAKVDDLPAMEPEPKPQVRVTVSDMN